MHTPASGVDAATAPAASAATAAFAAQIGHAAGADAQAHTSSHAGLRARRVALACAIAYTVALLLVIAVLRLVGESWWVATFALYLPRVGWALPLPLVVVALLIAGPRRLLWWLPIPIALLLFPLMGLRLGAAVLLKPAQAAGPSFRVLSYNISSASRHQEIAHTITAARPDLVLLQEWDWRRTEPFKTLLPAYHRHYSGQFAVLSRYPISDVSTPPALEVPNSPPRTARFIRYRIETGFGSINVFNVHPVSPRNGLEEFRGTNFVAQLRQGKFGHEEGIAALRRNAVLRWRQAEAIAEAAAQVEGPVIIAGDTNLPGLSRIFAQTLDGFIDGFEEAGRGFGYTFPSTHPWMRIDRILASEGFVFERFAVLAGDGSDHLAITADLRTR